MRRTGNLRTNTEGSVHQVPPAGHLARQLQHFTTGRDSASTKIRLLASLRASSSCPFSAPCLPSPPFPPFLETTVLYLYSFLCKGVLSVWNDVVWNHGSCPFSYKTWFSEDCRMYQYCVHFYYWIIFLGRDVPQLIYFLTTEGYLSCFQLGTSYENRHIIM